MHNYFKEQNFYGGKNVITEYSKENKMLIVQLTEEIDQHTTDKIRRKMDNEIEKFIPRKVLFDFSNISFMDSSGIGLVLRKVQIDKNARRRFRNNKSK